MQENLLRIFILEDEALILSSFLMSLGKMGYEVCGYALDGSMAADMILNLEPDLILLDVNLPGKDGLSVLNEVNQKKLIPGIVISGYCSEQLVNKANEIGAFAYLVKPVNEKQLMASIEIAMSRFREFEEASNETSDLKIALANRKYIEKAKGILMNRFGVAENEAMRRLQKKSRDQNKKLIEAAKEIIEADKALG